MQPDIHSHGPGVIKIKLKAVQRPFGGCPLLELRLPEITISAQKRLEASFADGRLNALALFLLKGLGVRLQAVGALSALEAYDP